MEWEQRCLRLCAAVLVSAALLRLAANGGLAAIGQALENPNTASFLTYLQTGRVVRLGRKHPSLSIVELPDSLDEPSEPIRFSAADAELVEVLYNCDRSPDIPELLTQELNWDLTEDSPSVLILHTHTTESYTKAPGDTYEESSDYRTLDPGYNMLCLGELVAQILEDAGIGVIHDTGFHDYPSYNGSYNDAAGSTQEILEAYPSIQLVLDIHRDAADTTTGQMSTQCSVGGVDSAQIMFVVGTDQNLNHPDWASNLSLALKLQVLLEQENPGICRNLNLTRHRYNQQLGDRALLIEIGAAGNTLAEAKVAAAKLAEAIVKLKYGSVSPD